MKNLYVLFFLILPFWLLACGSKNKESAPPSAQEAMATEVAAEPWCLIQKTKSGEVERVYRMRFSNSDAKESYMDLILPNAPKTAIQIDQFLWKADEENTQDIIHRLIVWIERGPRMSADVEKTPADRLTSHVTKQLRISFPEFLNYKTGPAYPCNEVSPDWSAAPIRDSAADKVFAILREHVQPYQNFSLVLQQILPAGMVPLDNVVELKSSPEFRSVAWCRVEKVHFSDGNSLTQLNLVQFSPSEAVRKNITLSNSDLKLSSYEFLKRSFKDARFFKMGNVLLMNLDSEGWSVMLQPIYNTCDQFKIGDKFKFDTFEYTPKSPENPFALTE